MLVDSEGNFGIKSVMELLKRAFGIHQIGVPFIYRTDFIVFSSSVHGFCLAVEKIREKWRR